MLSIARYAAFYVHAPSLIHRRRWSCVFFAGSRMVTRPLIQKFRNNNQQTPDKPPNSQERTDTAPLAGRGFNGLINDWRHYHGIRGNIVSTRHSRSFGGTAYR